MRKYTIGGSILLVLVAAITFFFDEDYDVDAN